MATTTAAIGFRVKTGRATAVVMAGSPQSPRVLERRAVELWDPRVPETKQPYHAALELPEKEGAAVVRRATAAVQAVAGRALAMLADTVRGSGHDLAGIGLVIGSDTNPETLHNAHMRAHAHEGRLFWRVLEEAAVAAGISYLVVLEGEVFEVAAKRLHRSADALRSAVAELGRPVGRPWGAEEKTATLAAWMALTA